MKKPDSKGIIGLTSVILLAACGTLWGGGSPSISTESSSQPATTATLTPFQPENYSAVPTSSVLSTSTLPVESMLSKSIWISPAVPDLLARSALASGLIQASDRGQAGGVLDVSDNPNPTGSTWIYVLVAPFPTLTDDIPLANLKSSWGGTSTGPFVGKPILMSPSTLAAFSTLWGNPADGAVKVVKESAIADLTWSDRPAWAIIPFEDLEPRWKVLSIDSQSPVHNDFIADTYPLKITFAVNPALVTLTTTNRDPDKLTVLAMTGVTALVRATADRMERHGVLYPGENIGSVLRSADLTHVSNEVSFYANCPTPDPWTGSLQFCSDPKYIDLLQNVGVDIVELTGNHLLDYGPGPMLTTLDIYDQLGWVYFGGGRDLADAQKVTKVTNHGNKLAFLGCNPAGPPSDWATTSSPGSAPCDYPQMKSTLAELQQEGYLPIVTFQYNEYYQPEPTDYEQRDFRAMADAGAVIVSGSQAHVPAAMEFDGNSFIHYGLGNLFFDQMSYQLSNGTIIYDTRNVFVDRHIFYDGRYLGTELLTYIIEDYSQPRVMTSAERAKFLQTIFSAAGW